MIEAARKHTERTMLDALHARYSGLSQGTADRFVRAEHPRNGTGFYGWSDDDPGNVGPLRTADFVALDLWPSKGYQVIGHEVKVSRSDWLTELRDPDKAEAWKQYCHRWYLVVPDAGLVRPGELPEGWGLLALRGSLLVRRHVAPVLTPKPMPPALQFGLARAVQTTARNRARD